MRFIFDDEVSALFEEDADYERVSLEQRISAVETAGQFDEVFLAPRPIFQRLRETEKESWSKSAAELAQALQKPGGAYWNYAIGLEFISNDHPQQQALRKIVSMAELPTSVRWYKEFSGQLSLSSAAKR